MGQGQAARDRFLIPAPVCSVTGECLSSANSVSSGG